MTMQDIERTVTQKPRVATPEDELARLDKDGQLYVADRFRKLVFGEAGLSREEAIGIALQELRAKRQKENAIRKPDFYEDQSLGARRDVPTHVVDMDALSPDERLDMFHDTPDNAEHIAHLTDIARGVAERSRARLADTLKAVTLQPDEVV